MKAILNYFCILLMGAFLSYGVAGAHSGGLDSNGGHYNRKTGEYHYHGKARATPPEPSTPHANQRIPNNRGDAKVYIWVDDRGVSHASDSPPENQVEAISREKRINEYFRSANENVGALHCDVAIHMRDVNEETKNRVKLSLGNKCIICGSTVKLEVDHRRALMNGGTNEITNLALLCDECHKIKTKYDNSLRRKRENICRRK